jgi:radical SAM superfamily enzyme YgiQ (UPF0313 family)
MSEDVITCTGDGSRTQALPGDFHQGMASAPAVDVLLICPNYASTALITDAVVYPINLAVLAAYLRARSVSVAIIDGRALDYRGDDFRRAIQSSRPKIVGITVMSSYVNRAADIARIAKSVSPEITVVVGGAHISALPSETLENFSCFDIAVAGEGEQTLYELADTIIHRKYRFDAIDGIYYREAGSIRRTRPRDLIADLDSLPYPAFDLLPLERYRPSTNWIKKLPFLMMYTVRGCPFSCNFCASNVNFGKTVRQRSAESVVAEIEYYKEKYGIKQVLFNDDLLVINKRQIHRFCDLLLERKTDIVWGCFSTVEALDAGLARKMKQAGCFMIFFGLESGSEAMLRRMNKNYRSPALAHDVISLVAESGIVPVGSFIFGYPGETEETAEQTISFACSLPLRYAMFTTLVPFPGAPIFTHAKDRGILPEKITDWDRFEACAKPFLLSELSEEQLLKYVKRAYGKFYFRPRIIAGAVKDSLSFYKLKNNISALGRITRLMLARSFYKKVCI